MAPQYATVEQLIALSLTKAAASKFLVDGTAAMTMNLQAASSKADMYLTSQLDLPLQQWGMMLSKIVCDIAAKELYAQYGYNPSASGDANIQKRYDEAIELLLAISKKELRIDENPEFIDSSSASGGQQSGPMVLSNAPVGFGTLCNDGDY